MKYFDLNDESKAWILFSLISLIFLYFSLLPYISNEYIGMSDYMNHLARVHLLTGEALEGWQKYYSIDHQLIPNLALDLIASYFVKFGMSPEVALRIFSAIANIIIVIGVGTVSWVINKRPPWLVLLVFPLAFNRYYIWGFLNYFFSVGLALLILALWVYSKSLTNKKNLLIAQIFAAILLIFTLLSHLMGYSVALLSIGVYELGLIIAAPIWRDKIINGFRIALVMFPSLFVYIFLCEHSTEEYPIVYQDVFQSKVSGLLSPFLSYELTLIPVYIIGFLLVLGLAFSSRSRTMKQNLLRSFPRYTGFVPLALFIVFIIAPSAMMNSYFLDKRLLVVVIFLLLSMMVYRLSDIRISLVICITLIMQITKFVEVNNVWEIQTRNVREIIQALNDIEVGSKIESYNFTENELMPIPPLQHAVSAAIYTRAAFVPTIFAKPVNAESIVMNEPYDVWGYSTGSYKYTLADMHMRNVCKNAYFYPYVMITFINKLPIVPACTEPIKQGEHFILYKVIDQKIQNKTNK